VRVNSRAPARHADSLPGNGGRQTSLTWRLAQYIDYVEVSVRACFLGGWGWRAASALLYT
jgi:hypothetical protein